MLNQTGTICRNEISGSTIQPQLCVGLGKVNLTLIGSGIGSLVTASENVGTPAATTLLSYVDTATGELTAAGETWALAQQIANTAFISGTIGDHFG